MDDSAHQEATNGMRALDATFLNDLQAEMSVIAIRNGSDATVDVAFLAYLSKMARFGFFTFGPITIDVRMIEDLVERTGHRRADVAHGHTYADDFVRFTRVLMEEVRRSSRGRVDDLHMLLAFMRCGEGLPGRVFGELGVTVDQVEAFARSGGREAQAALAKLYSPEEAAAYLGVHVQTVRGWIRSGRLPASRLAGQRALRIRAGDLEAVLEPIDVQDVPE